MKGIILFSLILLISISAIGQKKDKLNGKWKIVTINTGFFHDFRNDSTFYPPELLESLKGSNDSLFMIGFFDGMIKGFQNYYYEFSENNDYQENKNGKIKAQGKYNIIPKDKKIILETKDKFGGETKQTMFYALDENMLVLKIPSDEMELKIELIKVE